MKRLPISAAKEVAEKYKQAQVIIVTWDKGDNLCHIVSYGVDKAECLSAAQGANIIKRALGWPEDKEVLPGSPRDRAKLRPLNYAELTAEAQWQIDKQLGILDWNGK